MYIINYTVVLLLLFIGSLGVVSGVSGTILPSLTLSSYSCLPRSINSLPLLVNPDNSKQSISANIPVPTKVARACVLVNKLSVVCLPINGVTSSAVKSLLIKSKFCKILIATAICFFLSFLEKHFFHSSYDFNICPTISI